MSTSHKTHHWKEDLRESSWLKNGHAGLSTDNASVRIGFKEGGLGKCSVI